MEKLLKTFKHRPIRYICDLLKGQYIFKFENGFGASVIRGTGTYGGDEGLYELAVLKFSENGYDYTLDKTTGIISDDDERGNEDFVGWLEVEDVNCLLDRIEKI